MKYSRHTGGCCHKNLGKKNFDYLLWGSLGCVFLLYLLHLLLVDVSKDYWLAVLSSSVYGLLNTVWWGIIIGMVMIGILSKIPSKFVVAALGNDTGFRGIVRATLGGVLLDLCNHGILMVGAKLYERGISIGQFVAFLVASPWNSFSLTVLLIALIGLPWTLAFIALSLVLAIIAGMIFDWLVQRGVLPENPNKIDLPKDFQFWKEAKKGLKQTNYNASFLKDIILSGIKDSQMVLRWIMFGIVLSGLVTTFIKADSFQTYFGPTLLGLGLTVLVATVMEVCSEGSVPIAADLFTRAKAPGNSFAFLMTGVSTDYTEIMILKDTTKSWRIAFALPIITVPQVVVIAMLLNMASS